MRAAGKGCMLDWIDRLDAGEVARGDGVCCAGNEAAALVRGENRYGGVDPGMEGAEEEGSAELCVECCVSLLPSYGALLR